MRKIAFVCPEPCISGGVNVIFRHAMELARGGITVAIVCKTPVAAAHVGWHPIAEMADHPNLLWLDHNEALSHRFDLAIATWWRTFFDLWKVQADRYAYFVQSIESRFYPLEERVVRAAVDATYEAPLGIITEARWIRDYFHRLHGRDAGLAPNGIDKAIFTEIGDVISPRSPGRLRVLVEGALDAAFKNVPASIRLAREGGADEIWLLTPSAADTVEGIDRVFSRIAQARVASVYRSCDVILKLSLVEGMFGPPLEMFHCGGTAIVYNVTGHDEYIVHGRNALVAERHDEAAVVRFIRQLKDFPPFLEALKANARDTAAQWPDWPAATAQFRDAMEKAAANAAFDRDSLGRYSRRIWTLVEGSWRQAAPPPLGAAEQVLLARAAEQVLLARIEAIYRSSSWRLTRPLRGLSRAVREKGFAAMAAASALRQFQTSLRNIWN
jgi:glycosyltransferase involved in cell wall biosynthesis